tara:strand:- start:196 stop:444 length:249 start_codon:yes stop_codon:yes gene_type:complete
MNCSKSLIHWPNNKISYAESGESWLEAAEKAGVSIPTGCLGGSCGACEIEVNGEVIRACIQKISNQSSQKLEVDFSYDPFWG